MLKNNKGLTLIELLIALSLIGLVLALATQFFITNNHLFNYAREKTRLTSHAQYVQEQLASKGLESDGIKEVMVVDEGSYLIKKYSPSEQDLITNPKNMSHLKLGDNIEFKFEPDNQIISLNGTVLANNVSQFTVLPIPENETFEGAQGIKVILKLNTTNTRKSIEYETSTIIGFRNR